MIEEFSFTNVLENRWGLKTCHVGMWAQSDGENEGGGLMDEFVQFFASHGVEWHVTPGQFCMQKTKSDEGVIFVMVPRIDMKGLEHSFKCIHNIIGAAPEFQEMVNIYRELLKKIPNDGLFE